mmetsp:Transcript_15238/g.22294  ORF Transcript_15238/g.22294 Transcript_15238/m.22294 type:complete len:185 (-) Transcript_15238:79-633(-)
MSAKDVCDGCGDGEGQGNLTKCGKCLDARYCSKGCQKTHWARHKIICYKIQGNQQFKLRSFQAAAALYQKGSVAARSYLEKEATCAKAATCASAQVCCDAVLKTLVHLLSNKAQCFIHLQMWDDAMKEARSAVEIDPSHAKSQERLTKAQYEVFMARELRGGGGGRRGVCPNGGTFKSLEDYLK